MAWPLVEDDASARGKAMRKLGDLVAANANGLPKSRWRDNGKLMAEMLASFATIGMVVVFRRVVDKLSKAFGADRQGRYLRLHRCMSRSASWRHSRRGTPLLFVA